MNSNQKIPLTEVQSFEHGAITLTSGKLPSKRTGYKAVATGVFGGEIAAFEETREAAETRVLTELELMNVSLTNFLKAFDRDLDGRNEES